jgi:hypothetical protein
LLAASLVYSLTLKTEEVRSSGMIINYQIKLHQIPENILFKFMFILKITQLNYWEIKCKMKKEFPKLQSKFDTISMRYVEAQNLSAHNWVYLQNIQKLGDQLHVL